MDDSAKYLIHATIAANGVVERSDVVGAIFGQTEGLLGEDLDLRDLQQSSKVGRIDVEIDSENGQSYGEVTIASNLDRVETSVLAASLETITRIGPCKASLEVTDIEDVRAAKRREVVERAKELLSDSFDSGTMTTQEIVEEVRESVRVEDITEYAGLPAGPRVEDSDAVVIVEGRADVLNLLRYGIKNAIAVEGTDVPDDVAELTQDRTVTAFLDGDRGGELILRELAQVGTVDYVVFAPEGRSVEDLERHEVMSALREKVPYDQLPEDGNIQAAVASATDAELRQSSTEPIPAEVPEETADGASDGVDEISVEPTDAASDTEPAADATAADVSPETPAAEAVSAEASAPDASAKAASGEPATESTAESAERTGESIESESATERPAEPTTERAMEEPTPEPPTTLREHVEDLIEGDTGRARLLDEDLETLAEVDAADAFDAIEGRDTTPYALVLDAEAGQRILDIAAQRGVDHVVARSLAEYVKQPVSVRVRTADQVLASRSPGA